MEKYRKIRCYINGEYCFTTKKCGGDCRHCDKCHIYTRWTERAGYMAVGCDLLPSELYDYIASVPSQLHAAAVELVKFELS